jgi:ubiquinone/menaquinone biosynthesis C-methylase UbiE
MPSFIPSTTEEVRRAYNENASLYAVFEPVAEYLGLRRIRRRLLQKASGDVLEVAVGTGANLHYYPTGCRLTAVDVSETMLEHARNRAERIDRQIGFRRMDAEALDFSAGRFDTVVSTMTLCTFIHPVEALREMSRVCTPGGKLLLMEHGRSRWGWLGRWQDRREHQHAKQVGCHWNREPLELVQGAGLEVVRAQRHFFGILHEIAAVPSRASYGENAR